MRLLLGTLALCASSAIAQAPVRTTLGQLTGTTTARPSVRAYLGVPFAAPPVGDLRFRAPKSGAAWSGVRAADKFSPSCMQPGPAAFGPWTLEFLLRGPVSEDCLYLNVWTAAAPNARRPVLVFIHGGGFGSGSGDVPVYDGAHLAEKGLVVVTVNYRVGALGFLAHPALTAESPEHASGNYGLLDQVAALEWVKANAAAFGGDPTRVTVSGQSAGAMSVFLLGVSPKAKGLFQRAIVESGPGGLASMGVTSSRSGAIPLADAEQAGVRYADARNAKTAAELRALPATAFVGGQGMRAGPVIDGAFLPQEPAAIIAAGKQNDVAMLTGMNADEGSANTTYASLATAQKDSARDRGLTSLHALLVERATTARTPAFVYYFDRAIPWPERPNFAAFHTSEVPYVFGTLDVLPRPWTDLDRKLSDTMMTYWINFATKADPNGPNVPAWPVFDGSKQIVMELGERVGPRPSHAP